MSKRSLILAVLAVLAAGTVGLPAVATSADGVPAASGRTSPTRELGFTLLQFVGLPPDSASRLLFMKAFRDELDLGKIPFQRLEGASWAPADTHATGFRLLEAAPPGETWTLELSMRLPPQVRVERRERPGQPMRTRVGSMRGSRGLILAATPRAPAYGGRPVETQTTLYSLYFPDARRVLVPSAGLPGGGYAYPWADAGRAVARAALEALLRANGQMTKDQRSDLAPAERVEATP